MTTTPPQPDFGDAGPIPEENQPGHHPDHEQDKPTRPPRPKARAPKPSKATVPDPARFGFAFDGAFRTLDRMLGVTPENSYIEVAGERVTIRFGRWVAQTTRDNVKSADVTGPFAVWKVLGPPHLSLADFGVTFATNARQGVCIQLASPVKAIEPLGVLRHRGITVTPSEPEQLVEALTRG